MIGKILITLKEIRKTAYHHYGNNPFSILKFLYYGLFRINEFLVFEHDFSKKPPQCEFERGFKVITPNRHELEELRRGKSLPREFYYDKIEDKMSCFLALYLDEIAYIHWVSFRSDYSRFLKMTSDAVAEINYVTTLPEFRGKRLAAKMLAYTLNHLKENGCKKVFVICHKENPPMIRSVKFAGFKEYGKIYSFGPFNKRIYV